MSENQAQIERLHEMRAASRLGGGQTRIDKQHAKGKLTARERLELLLDPDSFVEFDAFVTHRSRDFGLDEQRFLGDGLASATAVHEATHAKDHAEGKLNPIEVKKGEIAAFKAEYLWLLAMDRRGEKLAWARTTYCRPDSQAPELVCQYLKHLAKIKHFGERDDFKGLVEALGYQDRSKNPFHFHDDEHQQAPPSDS